MKFSHHTLGMVRKWSSMQIETVSIFIECYLFMIVYTTIDSGNVIKLLDFKEAFDSSDRNIF